MKKMQNMTSTPPAWAQRPGRVWGQKNMTNMRNMQNMQNKKYDEYAKYDEYVKYTKYANPFCI